MHFLFPLKGNVNFEGADQGDGLGGCRVASSSRNALAAAAAQLDVTQQALEEALGRRVVAARGEVMHKEHTVPQVGTTSSPTIYLLLT